MKKLQEKEEKRMIELFARAIYMGWGLPFYSDNYPTYRLTPEIIKEDMRRLGKAAYKEYIKMCKQSLLDKKTKE